MGYRKVTYHKKVLKIGEKEWIPAMNVRMTEGGYPRDMPEDDIKKKSPRMTEKSQRMMIICV